MCIKYILKFNLKWKHSPTFLNNFWESHTLWKTSRPQMLLHLSSLSFLHSKYSVYKITLTDFNFQSTQRNKRFLISQRLTKAGSCFYLSTVAFAIWTETWWLILLAVAAELMRIMSVRFLNVSYWSVSVSSCKRDLKYALDGYIHDIALKRTRQTFCIPVRWWLQ